MRSESRIVTGVGNHLIDWVPALLGLALLLACLAYSWDRLMMDQHWFRQTQTVISSYWMTRGAGWLAYETPVMGPPWTIPFEFPFYQQQVALLASTLPLSVDQAARLIGVVWAVFAFGMCALIIIEMGGSATVGATTVAALLSSPLYLFWSRSGLIESTALGLALAMVWLLLKFHRRQSPLIGVMAIFTAVLAALVKITTLFGVSLLGAALLVWKERENLRALRVRVLAERAWLPVLAIVLAMLVLQAWLDYSDALKSRSVFGSALASAGLGTWNFGTLEQKIAWSTWGDVVAGRALRETIGTPWLLVIAGLALVATRRYQVWIATALCLCLYAIPFAVFTNLHLVHTYYQYANALFLVAAVTIPVGCWLESKRGLVRLASITALVALNVVAFSNSYLPLLKADAPAREVGELADLLSNRTARDGVFLGVGLDWSSHVPYYSERKALLVPDWVVEPVFREIAEAYPRVPGGEDLAAAVICPNELSKRDELRLLYSKLIKQLLSEMQAWRVGACLVFTPLGPPVPRF